MSHYDARDLRAPLTALRLLLDAIDRFEQGGPTAFTRFKELQELIKDLRVHYPREGQVR